MKEQWPLALTLLIAEVNIIQPPCGVNTGGFGVGFLLPVEPPEVDALLLEGTVDEIEIVHGVLLVGDVKGNVQPGRGIDAHRPCHRGIGVFPGLNAGRGMQVERGLQPHGVQIFQELVGIGE